MRDSNDADLWRERLLVVERAQGRIFVALALSGLFFYIVSARVSMSDGAAAKVVDPLTKTEIAAATVLITAPIVLGFLLLAVLGAHAASARAASQFRAASGDSMTRGIPEQYESSFNLIDAAAYTTEASPSWMNRVGRSIYPALLTVFWLEAGVFLAEEFARPAADSFPLITYPFWQSVSAWTLRALGLAMVLAPIPRLLGMWRRPSSGAPSG